MTKVDQLLVEAVRVALDHPDQAPHRLPALTRDLRSCDVVARAQHHGVTPALHLVLAGLSAVDDDLRAMLAADYHQSVRTHLLALDGLRTLTTMLADVTPWLVVKGPVLSSSIYQRPDLRRYVDLDVLVPPARFRDAVGALERQGCQLLDRNWEIAQRDQPGELRVMLPSGLSIDLHWHLFNRPGLRSTFPLDIDKLVETSRAVDVSGVQVRTLGRAATLVHLAVHACFSGGDRLSWAADLDQAIRHDQPPWDATVELAHRQRLGLVVGVMLRRCDRSIRLDVPEGVLERLAPRRGWAGLTSAIDAVTPIERCSGRPSVARIVLRATRRTGWASAAELSRRSASWVHGGARREHRPPDHDPTSPRSFLFETGGPAARAAYFDAVEATTAAGPLGGGR